MGEPALRILSPTLPFAWGSGAWDRRGDTLTMTLASHPAALTLELIWPLDSETGVLSAHVCVCNVSTRDIVLGHLASLHMPLPGGCRLDMLTRRDQKNAPDWALQPGFGRSWCC